MKKLFFSLFCITIACAACNTDPVEIMELTQDAPQSRTSVVPLNEALGQLDAVMTAIAQDTRSEGAFDCTKTIGDIQVSGGALSTRSGENDLPDTMAYVVNFTDGKGFAVLGAQRTLEPVYAITEAGSFDASKLNDAIARAENRRRNPVPATRSDEKERIFTDIGTDFAYELLAEAMVAQPRIGAPDTISKSYGPWKTLAVIGPLVEVKWDQDRPFNMSMPNSPYSDKTSSYEGRYPVGCGIIAAAQMMTCTRRPTLAPAGSKSYSWTALKTISNYTNLDLYHQDSFNMNNFDSATKTYMHQLADVLYYLGTRFCAIYNKNGTGVYIGDVADSLKVMDPSYYANARVVTFNTNMISTMDHMYGNLENNKPIYTRGASTSGTGHAWVMDGYLKRSRSVVCTLSWGGTVTTTEYSRLLHLNWGYSGNSDGYYAEGIFDMKQRISQDDIIDVFTEEEYRSSYCINNQMILY